MKTLLYVLTISGLTVGTKLIEIAYNLGLGLLIRRTNLYKITKANLLAVFANKSNMLFMANQGHTTATDFADYLVKNN